MRVSESERVRDRQLNRDRDRDREADGQRETTDRNEEATTTVLRMAWSHMRRSTWQAAASEIPHNKTC